MSSNKYVRLRKGMETAFIDSSVSSNLAYKPEFVSNNYKEGRKVLSSIEGELLACQEFSISVAFITMSGLTPLLQTLKELEKRDIKGRILTTDYLNFSEPQALKKLSEFKNITLKMFLTNQSQEGFHTKGYIFRKEEIYRIIIGSSNMTLGALTRNKEWNAKIVSTNLGEYTRDILAEFEKMWNADAAKDYSEFIETYSLLYGVIKKQRQSIKQSSVASIEAYKLQPNAMQLGFIDSLQRIQNAGEKRHFLFQLLVQAKHMPLHLHCVK